MKLFNIVFIFLLILSFGFSTAKTEANSFQIPSNSSSISALVGEGTPSRRDITFERARYLFNTFPITNKHLWPFFTSSDPIPQDSTNPQVLYDMRYDEILVPQMYAFGPHELYAPTILPQFVIPLNMLTRMLVLGPKNPLALFHFPNHTINYCNILYHILTNAGIHREDFQDEGFNFFKKNIARYSFDIVFQNFTISNMCLDYEAISQSNYLIFFCLYCPINQYPDTLSDSETAISYDEKWLAKQQISAAKFKEINDFLEKKGVRKFFKKLYEKKGTWLWDTFLFPHWHIFTDIHLLYCHPKNIILDIIFGERFVACLQERVNECSCEDFFSYFTLYLTWAIVTVIFFFALPCCCCFGCCCGVIPQCLSCCLLENNSRRRKRAKSSFFSQINPCNCVICRKLNQKTAATIYWCFSILLFCVALIPKELSQHYYQLIEDPYVMNVFRKNAPEMDILFYNDMLWILTPFENMIYGLWEPTIDYLYHLGVIILFIACVMLTFHFFNVSSIFQDYSPRFVTNMRIMMFFLNFFFHIIVLAIVIAATVNYSLIIIAFLHESYWSTFFSSFHYGENLFGILIADAVKGTFFCYRALLDIFFAIGGVFVVLLAIPIARDMWNFADEIIDNKNNEKKLLKEEQTKFKDGAFGSGKNNYIYNFNEDEEFTGDYNELENMTNSSSTFANFSSSRHQKSLKEIKFSIAGRQFNHLRQRAISIFFMLCLISITCYGGGNLILDVLGPKIAFDARNIALMPIHISLGFTVLSFTMTLVVSESAGAIARKFLKNFFRGGVKNIRRMSTFQNKANISNNNDKNHNNNGDDDKYSLNGLENVQVADMNGGEDEENEAEKNVGVPSLQESLLDNEI